MTNEETNDGALRTEPQDLSETVREYFRSMNPADLEGALVVMATRLQALEATVSGLRAALGH